MFIVAVGDAFDGISFYGPFDYDDDAISWAVKSNITDTWTVVPLRKV